MIAFDNATTASGGTSNDYSFNHTATGSNLLIVVGVEFAGVSTDTITSITYNGVALTKIAACENFSSGGNPRTITFYYLLGAASGTNAVRAQRSETSNGFHMIAATYTGVKTSGAMEASKTKTAGPSVNPFSDTTVPSVTTGSWHIWCVSAYNDVPTAGANTTRRAATYAFAIMDTNGPNTLNASESNGYWAGVLAAFAPAPEVTSNGSILFFK